jgi:hypothetical protein
MTSNRSLTHERKGARPFDAQSKREAGPYISNQEERADGANPRPFYFLRWILVAANLALVGCPCQQFGNRIFQHWMAQRRRNFVQWD